MPFFRGLRVFQVMLILRTPHYGCLPTKLTWSHFFTFSIFMNDGDGFYIYICLRFMSQFLYFVLKINRIFFSFNFMSILFYKHIILFSKNSLEYCAPLIQTRIRCKRLKLEHKCNSFDIGRNVFIKFDFYKFQRYVLKVVR